jgi:hypothetical protein
LRPQLVWVIQRKGPGLLFGGLMDKTLIYFPAEFPRYLLVCEPEEHICRFTAYEIDGTEGEGDQRKYLFHKPGWDGPGDWVHTHEEAESFATGHVKWDGCMNWTIDESDRCMLHFCGMEGLELFFQIFRRAFEFAKHSIPKWVDI